MSLRNVFAQSLLFFCCLLSSALARPLKEINEPDQSNKSLTAIVGARLIDGQGGKPIPDATVVVKGNRIDTVGATGKIDIPEGAKRVNAEGLSLLPGLIDSHFHSKNNNDLLHRFLSNGVTALRDPGHPMHLYSNLQTSKRPMPRVFLTGGHLDGDPPVHPEQAVVVRNKTHARRAVTRHVNNGATGIKIYFRLPFKYYRPICEEAHEQGLPVTAHLELVDADDAIRAGLDGIEHVTSFGTALAKPEAAELFKERVRNDYSARHTARYELWSEINLESERTRELIDLIVQEDVFVSPTLAVYEPQSDSNDTRSKAFRKMLKFTGMCNDAGAKIVAGSHTRVARADKGWAYQREMELLVKSGLTPGEAIQAATMNNARFFRTSERLGSVEPGKLADLLLVEGNPVENIRCMYNIERVMSNGRWVE